MTPLVIALISVLGFIALISIIIVVLYSSNKKEMNDKAKVFFNTIKEIAQPLISNINKIIQDIYQQISNYIKTNTNNNEPEQPYKAEEKSKEQIKKVGNKNQQIENTFKLLENDYYSYHIEKMKTDPPQFKITAKLKNDIIEKVHNGKLLDYPDFKLNLDKHNNEFSSLDICPDILLNENGPGANKKNNHIELIITKYDDENYDIEIKNGAKGVNLNKLYLKDDVQGKKTLHRLDIPSNTTIKIENINSEKTIKIKDDLNQEKNQDIQAIFKNDKKKLINLSNKKMLNLSSLVSGQELLNFANK